MTDRMLLLCGWCDGKLDVWDVEIEDDLTGVSMASSCDQCHYTADITVHAEPNTLECPVCMERDYIDREGSLEDLDLPVICLGFEEEGCDGRWSIRYRRVEINEVDREAERARERRRARIVLGCASGGATGGWIYVARNSSLPGRYKVGMTERSVPERLKELSVTGLPDPSEEAYKRYSAAPQVHEQQIHARLAKYRVTNDREFFEGNITTIIDVVMEVVGP